MIKIDRKVPLPGKRRPLYPWESLKVGDSFFVADRSVRTGIYTIAARHGYKITVRNDGEGVRVWRTA